MFKKIWFILLLAFLGGGVLSVEAEESSSTVTESHSVVALRWWLDNVDKDKVHEEKWDNAAPFTLNVTDLQLSSGFHTIYYQLKDNENIYSDLKYLKFYCGELSSNNDVEEKQDILIAGYRMGLNNNYLGDFSISPASTSYDGAISVEQEIPSIESLGGNVANGSWSVVDNKVEMSLSVPLTFYIQFKSDGNPYTWSAPIVGSTPWTETKIEDADNLDLNKSVFIQKTGNVDFKSFVLDIQENSNFVINALNACEVRLLNANGVEEKHYSGDEIIKINTKGLSVGKYFIVIYHVNDNNSFRISTLEATKNPNISLTEENGVQTVTITSEEEDAQIYYSVGGDYQEYKGTFPVTHNGTIKAYAVKEGKAESHIISKHITGLEEISCENVSFVFDGKTLTMSSNPGATIYYTTDGSDPTEKSNKGRTVELKKITTVKAFATMADMEPSGITTYRTPSVYDGKVVTVEESGKLADAFGWSGKNGVDTLAVKGKLNDADVDFIASFTNLVTLDMTEAKIETLKDRALSSMPSLLVVYLPNSLKGAGKELLADCRSLATVKWNANLTIPENMLDGIDNPNLLVYLDNKDYVPSNSTLNFVYLKSGTFSWAANSITLKEPENLEKSYGNFYALNDFTASKISYSRVFDMETGLNGEVKGWETLSLPFVPTEVTHETQGNIYPFDNTALNSGYNEEKYDKARPYWFCIWNGANTYNQSDVSFINYSQYDKSAGYPFIISMPNNPVYANRFILKGKVVFSAQNKEVSSNVITLSTYSKDLQFVGNFIYKDKADDIYVLNTKEGESDVENDGSTFVAGLRGVKPFEAYMKKNGNQQTAYSIKIDGGTTGIYSIPLKQAGGLNMWIDGNVLYLESDDKQKVRVYDMKGILVKSVSLNAHEKTKLSLSSGMYIVNNKKVVIK